MNMTIDSNDSYRQQDCHRDVSGWHALDETMSTR